MDTTESHYTEIEVQDLLGCLGDADLARLLQIYRIWGCSKRAGLSENDVLTHAVIQALALERRWPRDVTMIAYLTQSGRSIISNEEEKRSRLVISPAIEDLAVMDDGALVSSTTIAQLAHPAAESHIEKAESSSVMAEWIGRIQQLFEGDADADCFIKQKLAQQKKANILSLCTFTDQVYQNVEKRIKDKVRKNFPDGFPWWEVES